MSAGGGEENRPVLAAAILLGGIFSVALMDALAKLLSESLPVMQINWARFFFHSLLTLPMVLLLLRRQPLRQLVGEQRRHAGLHALRGLMLAGSSFCFFFAISENPVPDALAIFFIEPLIVMLFARLFIGERFNRRLLIAAVCGLIGVLVILRPGVAATGYTWKILFSFAAACLFAGYIVSARHVAGNTPAVFTSWTTALFGLLPVSLVMLFTWQVPELKDWLLMAAVGCLSGLGHTLIILALRYASASYISVLHYVEVPVAVLINWFIFAHFPDVFVWVGVALIACANFYAIRHKAAKA